MKNKVYFIGIFLITLVLAATHQGEFPRFLLGFELLLFIGLFVDAKVLGRNVTARLKLEEIYGSKNGDFKVDVELSNTAKIPIPEIRVELGYRDLYNGNEENVSGTAMLDSDGRAILCFHLTSKYCGAVAFWLAQVQVPDHLGIFWGKCRSIGGLQEMSVLPDRSREVPEIAEKVQQFAADGDGFHQRRSGDDPSETYDIRAYMQGDTMHRIHWKMTAKTDEMMVRDFGQPVERVTLLLLDLCKGTDELTREKWDFFLETVASLSDRLLKLGLVHFAAWLDTKSGAVTKLHVGSEEELQAMLAALLRAPVYEQGEAETYYKEKYSDETLGEIIRIDLKGQIRREKGEEN